MNDSESGLRQCQTFGCFKWTLCARDQTYFWVPVGSPEVTERDGDSVNGKTWELASRSRASPLLH